MNIRALRYFKTVAEVKHLTKAANLLFLTQSALSKTIRNLESELEVTLVEKQGRNITLTRSGELFYQHVVCALSEIDEGIAKAKYQEEIKNHTIFIAAVFSSYAMHLPEKILSFRQQHPDCRFSIEYKYTSAILRDLRNDDCELGICGEFPSDKEFSKIDRHILYREPAAIFVGKNHRLAGRELVRVEELKEESFIIWNRSQMGTNKVIMNLCESHGFEANIAIEAFNDFGVLSLVAMGEGIAIIPTTGNYDLSKVVPIRLDIDYQLTRDIYVAWQKTKVLSPMAAQFRNSLIESATAN